MVYNGEKLYAQRMSFDGAYPEGLYQSERLKAEFQGKERPKDIAKQCYADLCFNIDYFFGHPGKAPLDRAVAESGLDQALSDLGKKGESLIRKLQSENLVKQRFLKYRFQRGRTVFHPSHRCGKPTAVGTGC